ncbi:MFS transporter [Natrialbaceae archaeon A-gly3]
MSRHTDTGRQLWWKLVLSVGFLSISGAALVAHLNPATGYEVSVYAMTTPWTWIGLVVAVSAASLVSFSPTVDRMSYAMGLVLGGLVVVVFAGLPIIRGYRFYGRHDALTHLGWARAIGDGTMSPFELFYPGIHTLSTIISVTLEIPPSRSLFLVVLCAVLLFCVFTILCVRTVRPTRRATAIGAFSAFLLLPITGLAMILQPHAISQAVLFSTVLFFLFLQYVRIDRNGAVFSATGVLLFGVAVAAVVYHPQLVAHLIAVFVAISVVQFVSRRFWSDGRIAGHTPVYGFTVFLIGLFLVWTSNFGFFSGMFEYFFDSLIEYVFGSASGGEATVAARGSSLGAAGGSLLEVFFKLFFVHFLVGLLIAGLALGLLVSRTSEFLSRIRPDATYLLAGLAGLVPVFFVYFASAGSTLYFRVVGLMMVLVTILGAIATDGLVERLGSGKSPQLRSLGRSALSVTVVVLLVLSLATIFPSPYIYQNSPHVSDTQMSGYETAFEVKDEDVMLAGFSDGPNRFDDGINGNTERMGLHEGPPESSLEELSAAYDEDHYFVITQTDYEQQAIVYGGFRYSAHDFQAVETQRDVDRIHSNEEFDMYYLNVE